jgi:dynactin complex subunit
MANSKQIKLSDVRRVAGLQCTHAEAAAFFSISKAKWTRVLKSDERVRKAWEEGIETGKLSLRRKQMRLADTNAQMAIHLGKQYLEQTDVRGLEVSGRNGAPVEMVDLTKLTASERKELRKLLTKPRADSSAT